MLRYFEKAEIGDALRRSIIHVVGPFGVAVICWSIFRKPSCNVWSHCLRQKRILASGIDPSIFLYILFHPSPGFSLFFQRFFDKFFES